MSLDVYLTDADGDRVYEANITHNLNKMADAAGIYKHLWRPEEIGIERAKDLVYPLTEGLVDMLRRPAHYHQFNPENGWGSYDGFIPWIVEYIKACAANPDATVHVWR
ncbi:hypothetical protein [Burkholderia ubonensis]|uniref:hypothetical protein n=1 Tax=Burkholderia ubonensis TaxID=101571 RepID=UPI00075CE426|nr:hypothetical protein [Burkholderia ubonensis]KVC83986.1 hypothetical protein WI75_04770 [Burkholderia ubonensis]